MADTDFEMGEDGTPNKMMDDAWSKETPPPEAVEDDAPESTPTTEDVNDVE